MTAMYRCPRALVAGAVLAAMVMITSSAAADQQTVPDPGGVDVQNFRPAVGPGGLLTVESSATAEHLQPYGGLYLDMMSNPLTLSFDDGTRQPVVDHRLTANLMMGLGVMDRFQFELAMPVVMMDRGSYFDVAIEGGGPGDLQARSKATILSSDDAVVGLGAVLDLSVPTGADRAYRGSTTATATPQMIADSQISTPAGELVVAANTGVHLRGVETVHDLELGPQFVYGVGAELEVVPDFFSVGTDLYGAVDVVDTRRQSSPLELLVGGHFQAVDGLSITAAGGVGVIGGVGSPQWRGVLGVSYSPIQPRDAMEQTDDDITHHTAHECPPAPRGFEGPYDDEGCPITPETFDGCDGLDDDWEGDVDRWGCPLLDSDGDGFLVWDDECPHRPKEFVGEDDPDGCPNPDVDGDGIVNVEDHCPHEPGIRAYNGCPPPEDEGKVERINDEEIEISERVHFETSKALILEESYPLLEEVAMVIRNHSDILLVEVAGHTDQRGDADYNMMLSEERAKAVREFLIKRGNLNPARLTARGYGETEPRVDEDTDEAHAANRRVEFRIKELGEEGDADELQQQASEAK